MELVKLHMFHFYYDMVIPHWGRDNVKLLMTDTDSLTLEIKTEKFGQTWNALTRIMKAGYKLWGILEMGNLEHSNQRQGTIP